MAADQDRRLARSQPGMRLTPRGRALLAATVVGGLMLAVLAAFWLGTVHASRAAAGTERVPSQPSLVLRPGETLWEIAERRAPDTDPRAMVHRIMRANNLDGAAVWAGQRIRVPPPPG